jgi:hypothetical protein
MTLTKIGENKYYHDVLGYETFEEYCQQPWELQADVYFYLTESAKVTNSVHDCEQMPTIVSC